MADAAIQVADRVYDARAIANYLLSHTPGGLDALQVMKLTYISHGFTLALSNKPLLEDDIEAWKYGPAIRRVYSILPRGSDIITEPLSAHRPNFDANDREIVDSVLKTYGVYSGLYLSKLTHGDGSPWHRTWTTYGRDAVIPQDLIRAHYHQIITQFRAAQAAGREYQPTVL